MAKGNRGGKRTINRKPSFVGNEKFAVRKDEHENESSYLAFKHWERGDEQRIYINDYKGRQVGTIDADGKLNITDNQGMKDSEINTALKAFKSKYSMRSEPIDLAKKRFGSRELNSLSRRQLEIVMRDIYIPKRMARLGISKAEATKSVNETLKTTKIDRMRELVYKHRGN